MTKRIEPTIDMARMEHIRALSGNAMTAQTKVTKELQVLHQKRKQLDADENRQLMEEQQFRTVRRNHVIADIRKERTEVLAKMAALQAEIDAAAERCETTDRLLGRCQTYLDGGGR